MGITWVNVLNKVHRFREFLSRSDDGLGRRLLTTVTTDTEDNLRWFKRKGKKKSERLVFCLSEMISLSSGTQKWHSAARSVSGGRLFTLALATGNEPKTYYYRNQKNNDGRLQRTSLGPEGEHHRPPLMFTHPVPNKEGPKQPEGAGRQRNCEDKRRAHRKKL
jgi:hypothetical protein